MAGILWWNAFGPAALIAGLLFLIGGVLPDGPRARLAGLVTRLEKKTGITNAMFILLAVYWGCRLWILGGDLGLRLSAYP